MEIVAKLNKLRMAPRKMRLIADLIRGKNALRAKAELSFLARAGARPFAKLLDSAIANAKNNFQLDEQGLYIAKVFVDEGPKMKRWRPMSRGRAYPIQKKVSHLTIILDQIDGQGQKSKKIPKVMPVEETVAKTVREAPKVHIKDKKRAGMFTAKPRITAQDTKMILLRKSI
ncbi:MAG: 50S ribosomal protein L22 [bacterium]|nr:50S ribosomal protein L22 [bacterium]